MADHILQAPDGRHRKKAQRSHECNEKCINVIHEKIERIPEKGCEKIASEILNHSPEIINSAICQLELDMYSKNQLERIKTLMLQIYFENNKLTDKKREVIINLLDKVIPGTNEVHTIDLIEGLCSCCLIPEDQQLFLSSQMGPETDFFQRVSEAIPSKNSSLKMDLSKYVLDKLSKRRQWNGEMSKTFELFLTCQLWSISDIMRFDSRFQEVLSVLSKKRVKLDDEILNGLIRRVSVNKLDCKYAIDQLAKLEEILSTESDLNSDGNPFSEICRIIDENAEMEKDLGAVLDEIKETTNIEQFERNRLELVTKEVLNILRGVGFPTASQKYTRLLSEKQSMKLNCQNIGRSLMEAERNKQLAKVVSILGCAVHKFMGYWPRITQLLSCVSLIFSSMKKGQLLQIQTGEGKSTIIAMLATFLAFNGKDVDIVTSSPLLARRDAKEWLEFYGFFDLSVSHNTDSSDNSKTGIEQKKKCYQSQIVYGTVDSFAADILRQEFSMKETRGARNFDALIVDEVDLMMIDQGVQFTYLSHNAPGMHYIERVLAVIWAALAQYQPLSLTEKEAFYHGQPKLIIEILGDYIDLDVCKLSKPEDFLSLPQTRDLFQNSATTQEDLQSCLSNTQMITFLCGVEKYVNGFVPFKCNIYSLTELGNVVLRRRDSQQNLHGITLSILTLKKGKACILHDFEELKSYLLKTVKGKINFSACNDSEFTKISVPEYFKEFILHRLPTYIQSAIRALHLTENRQYLVENGAIIPIDHEASGVVEKNKRWGDGLQQFLEMKHSLKLSPVSVITNFMSNIAFFQKYSAIYGVSGTIGNDHADLNLIDELYQLPTFRVPTHKVCKRYELPAIQVDEGEEAWLQKICETVERTTRSKSNHHGGEGRCALVICEDIRSANLIADKIKSKGETKVTLYTRSDLANTETLLDREFTQGEAIIATNLAGRGTDIKVTDEVNSNGGLFVLMSYLPKNRRVELQAFGRTARKGQPGSVQLILNSSSLNSKYLGKDMSAIRKDVSKNETSRVNKLLKSDVNEAIRQQKLFGQYCRFLEDFRSDPVFKEKKNKDIILNPLHETWAQWLLMKREAIAAGTDNELSAEEDLQKTLHNAKRKVCEEKSPNGNFYHNIKIGSKVLFEKEKPNPEIARKARKHFEEAIDMEPKRAMIAHYYRAYCLLIEDGEKNKQAALEALANARVALKVVKDEIISSHQLLTASALLRTNTDTKDSTSHKEEETYNHQIQIQCQVLDLLDEKMKIAVNKLKELMYSNDGVATESSEIMSLIPNADTTTQDQLYEFYLLGLEVVYTLKEKPKFCWSVFLVSVLGALQVACGVMLTVFSTGLLANAGLGLISEGISDFIEGIKGMIRPNKFSLKGWIKSKFISLAVSLVLNGVSTLIKEGWQVFKTSAQQLLKDGKATIANIGKVTKGIDESTKNNIKSAFLSAGSELVMQGGFSAVEDVTDRFKNKIIKKILDGIRNKVKDIVLKIFKGKQLGSYIKAYLAKELPEFAYERNLIPPMLKEELINVHRKLGKEAVEKLVRIVKKDGTEIKSQATKLISEISGDITSVWTGKAGKKFGNVVESFIDCDAAQKVVKKAGKDIVTLSHQFEEELVKRTREFWEKRPTSTTSSAAKETFVESLSSVDDLLIEIGDKIANEFIESISDMIDQEIGKQINSIKSEETKKAVKEVLNGLRINEALEI